MSNTPFKKISLRYYAETFFSQFKYIRFKVVKYFDFILCDMKLHIFMIIKYCDMYKEAVKYVLNDNDSFVN